MHLRFHLGELSATAEVMAAARAAGVQVVALVLRHLGGDWGNVDDQRGSPTTAPWPPAGLCGRSTRWRGPATPWSSRPTPIEPTPSSLSRPAASQAREAATSSATRTRSTAAGEPPAATASRFECGRSVGTAGRPADGRPHSRSANLGSGRFPLPKATTIMQSIAKNVTPSSACGTCPWSIRAIVHTTANQDEEAEQGQDPHPEQRADPTAVWLNHHRTSTRPASLPHKSASRRPCDEGNAVVPIESRLEVSGPSL